MNAIPQSKKPGNSNDRERQETRQSAAPLKIPSPAGAIIKEDRSSTLASPELCQRSVEAMEVYNQSSCYNAQRQQVNAAATTVHPSSQQQLTYDDQSRLLPSNNNMMAHSQPSTPHPESNVQQQPADQQQQPVAAMVPYRQPTPSYSTGRSTSLRGRSSLFSNDVGPYFSSTKVYDNLYASDKQTLLSVRIQSKFDRGFFLADNDWTCYRRNYFQVSSVFSIHGFNHYYAVEPHLYVSSTNSNNEMVLYPVQRFLVGISARAANNDKSVDLIQHTPKRDKGPQYTPEPKPIMPGGNLSMSSVANNQNIVTFERIQFKTATANNGKRRAAQQYYVVISELFAETDRMELIKIGTCQSASLIVRGRSPGHYADSNNALAVTSARHNQHPYMYQQQPYPEPSASAPLPGSAGTPLMMGPPPPHHQQQQQQHHHHHQQAQPQPTPTTSSEPPMTPQLTPPLRQDIRSNSSMYYSATSTANPVKHEVIETPQHHQPQYDNNAVAAAAPAPQPSTYSYYSYYQQAAPYAQYIVHDGHDYYNNNHHQLPPPLASQHPSQHDTKYQATPLMYQQHAAYEFNRARYDSASSGSSSIPSPGGPQHHQQQPTPNSSTGNGTEHHAYFGQQHHPRSSPYSSPYPVMQQQPSSSEQQQQQQQQQTRMPPVMTKQSSVV